MNTNDKAQGRMAGISLNPTTSSTVAAPGDLRSYPVVSDLSVSHPPGVQDAIRTSLATAGLGEATRALRVPSAIEEAIKAAKTPTAFEEATRALRVPSAIEEAIKAAKTPTAFEEATRGLRVPSAIEEVIKAAKTPTAFEEATRGVRAPSAFEEVIKAAKTPTAFEEATKGLRAPSAIEEVIKAAKTPTAFEEATRALRVPSAVEEVIRAGRMFTATSELARKARLPSSFDGILRSAGFMSEVASRARTYSHPMSGSVAAVLGGGYAGTSLFSELNASEEVRRRVAGMLRPSQAQDLFKSAYESVRALNQQQERLSSLAAGALLSKSLSDVYKDSIRASLGAQDFSAVNRWAKLLRRDADKYRIAAESLLGRNLAASLVDEILEFERRSGEAAAPLKKLVEEAAEDALEAETVNGIYRRFNTFISNLEPGQQFLLTSVFLPIFILVMGVVLGAVINPVGDYYVKKWLDDSPQGLKKEANDRVVAAVGGTAVLADYRLVTAKVLVVRVSPAATAKRVADLPFGTPVRVLREDGAFTFVEWSSEDGASISGWVFTRYLKRFK